MEYLNSFLFQGNTDPKHDDGLGLSMSPSRVHETQSKEEEHDISVRIERKKDIRSTSCIL